MKKIKIIKPTPINKENFKKYGDVIDTSGDFTLTNRGKSKKWNNLTSLDMHENGGEINLGILRTNYLEPFFNQMERHHYTSQIFIPLGGGSSLVAVAPVSEGYPSPENVEVFLLNGRQGINIYRKVWHHTLFPLEKEQDYILMMRGGDFPLDVELVNLPNDIQVKIEI